MKPREFAIDLGLLVLVGGWVAWLIGWVPPAQLAAGAWAQKIFYLHVPSAMAAFVGFLMAAFMGLGVLFGEQSYWDRVLVPTVEVSYLFTCIVLLTGPLWAKPVWGIWWRWEPRLTSFFVLWLTYSGWFLLRYSLPEGAQRRTYSAVYAILASLNIVIVWVSISFWQPEQQLHPTSIQLDPTMEWARFLSMGVIFLVFLRLLWLRSTLERLIRADRGIFHGEP